MTLPFVAALAAVAGVTSLAAVITSWPAPAVVGPEPPRLRRVGTRLLRSLGGSRVGRLVSRERLRMLRSAADAGWSLDELVGAKILSVFVVTAMAMASPIPIAAVPLSFLAWRGPELLLGRQARRRLAEASAEVPLFLDLLAVGTSAGLAPQTSVRAAATSLVGPLADELNEAIRRTELGLRWRDELMDAADRLALGELHRAAALLARSESLGSTLAGEMSRLAADVREERRSRATERARTAPVKMLFPLVFLILPAFLLLTVVPVLLSTVRSIA